MRASCVALVLLIGCSEEQFSGRDPDPGGRADDGGAQSGGGGSSGTGGPAPVALAIAPADAVVDVGGPVAALLQLAAVVTMSDGATRDVTAGAEWSLTTTGLGVLGATGLFTAAGVGGRTTVAARYRELGAQTTLTARLRRTWLAEGVTAADAAGFDGAAAAPDPATGPAVDYPLAGAVMPRNVYAPLLMWTPRHPGAADGDLYRVRLERPNARLDAFLRAAPGFLHAWRPEAADWSALAGSDLGEDIRLTVTALSAGAAHEGPPLSFRTVDSVIAGSLYYWSPPAGRLFRIDVAEAARVDFLPNPPSGCIACHTISRDGRRLAAVVNHAAGAARLVGYDLTADLTGAPPPELFGWGGLWAASYNGAGDRIVAAPHGGGQLAILDTANGASVATAGEPLSYGLDPEWSPDSVPGSEGAIAWTRDNDLWLQPTSGDTLGAPLLLHDGESSPGGSVDWHPSWTPDSQRLVFQHGAGTYTGGSAALWMIARAGGAPVRLDLLDGAEENNWRPVLSPFDSGGYFWVLFTSGRAYGNPSAGIRGNKLMWVAALRRDPEPGEDPSEVPYFVDGQEPTTNLSPNWAPAPCRPNDEGCATGADCCSAACEPDETGQPVCRTPTDTCRDRAETCSVDDDCCLGMGCVSGGICDTPPPE